MTDINLHGFKGKLESTPRLINPPNQSVMNFNVTIDNPKMQELKKLRTYENACLRLPATLGNEGTIVAKCLIDCFEKAGVVQEGQLKDILWGFAQAEVMTPNGIMRGVPVKLTMLGIYQLNRLGYVGLSYANGDQAQFSDTQSGEAFLRYYKPFLDMLYEEA